MAHMQKSLSDLKNDELTDMIREFDELYHEKGKSSISDAQYDQLKDEAIKRGIADNIGFPVGSREAVKLPIHMGSMSKIKPDNFKALDRWKSKFSGPYVITDKLDGVSALLHERKMYKRGDGTYGRDISYLLQHIQGIPENLSSDIAVRGELVISKIDFNVLVDSKSVASTSNPRNTVAGLVNSKNIKSNVLEAISFVAFEIFHPRINQSDHYNYLKENGFKPVHTYLERNIHIDCLTQILKQRQKKSAFQIDGLVASDASAMHLIPTSGNPKHSFAFKLPMDVVETTVKHIEWKISKDKLIKPTVVFDTVTIGGVKINRASGHNAKNVLEAQIGPGAAINVERSGDVIPHITSVLKGTKPNVPEVPYIFNGIDFVVDEKEASDAIKRMIDLKSLQNTVNKLGIDGLRESTTKKLFDAGVTCLKDLFALDYERLVALQIDGFGHKKISSIISAIKKSKDGLDCLSLMMASNSFGKGLSYKSLKLLQNRFPKFLTETTTEEQVIEIQGIGTEMAKSFINGIERFKKYIRSNDLEHVCTKPSKTIDEPKPKSGALQGMKVVFSSGKYDDLKKIVEENGATISNSISKTVNYLIMLDPSTNSTKKKKAIEQGIPILNPDQFYDELGKFGLKVARD